MFMRTRLVRVVAAVSIVAGNVVPVARAVPAAPGASPLALPAQADLSAALAAQLEQPAAATPGDGEVRAGVEQMAKRFRAVDYDPGLRAKELAQGVEPALTYVRDHVRFEAYPGVFRGARGAYINRAANAPDRSLLLAELLRAKGVPVRFALGRLSRQDAEALYERMFAPAKAATAPDANPAGDSPRAAAFLQRLRARATRDYAAIRQALADQPAAAEKSDRAAVVEEIVPHVWVQAQVGENWVDLDSAFPDAAPGKRYAEAQRTMEKLPDDLHQRVTVRVLVEKLAGGAIKTENVLELTRPAVDLIDRQIFLIHTPEVGGGGGIGAIGGAPTGNWLPVLTVDGVPTRGKAIDFSEEAGAGGGGGGGGGTLGGFGGFGGLAGDADAGAAPVFVAEQLEFELTAPGRRKETTRRALADRSDPAWRRSAPLKADGLKPLPRDDKGPLAVQTIHNAWFSGGRHDLSSYTRAIKALTDGARAAAGDKGAPNTQNAAAAANAKPDLGDVLWPIALQNLPCVLWGDHALIPSLNDDPAVRFYLDSPRVLLFGVTARAVQGGEAGQIEVEMVTDLRRDKVRGVAKDAGGATAVAERKIWYGVLAGALEHEMAAEQMALMGGPEVTLASTSSLLADEGAAVLRPADLRGGAGWQQLAANESTAAALATDLARGETLIVPKQLLTAEDPGVAGAGWWAIAANGDTRAVWGPDIHATVSRSPLNMPTARPSGTVHYIFDDGSSFTKKGYQSGGGGGGGQEYTDILMEISIAGLEVTLTYGHAAIASASMIPLIILHGVFFVE